MLRLDPTLWIESHHCGVTNKNGVDDSEYHVFALAGDSVYAAGDANRLDVDIEIPIGPIKLQVSVFSSFPLGGEWVADM